MTLHASELSNHSPENALIESIEKRIYEPGDLADILEVTYAYEVRDLTGWAPGGPAFVSVNKTLFREFIKELWDLSEDVSISGKLAEDKLQRRIADVDESIAQLGALTDISAQGEILLGALKITRDTLQMTLLGLPFELEKAGVAHGFSPKKVSDIVEQIEELDVGIFGGRVSESPSETQRSLRTIYDLAESDRLTTKKDGPNLTDDERNEFLNILRELCAKTGVDFNDLTRIEKEASAKDPEWLKNEIPQEKYVKSFRDTLDFYGIDIPLIVEERGSIYDGPEALRIPENKKTLSAERVLALIAHEIESHYINQKNSEQILGKVRGQNNLYKEEWLAVLSEHLLKGKNIDDLDSETGTLPDILAGELLSAEDFRQYYLLKRKLFDQKRGLNMTGESRNIYLRRKRNYPFDYPGVQHKDTSYNRGLSQTVDFIQKGGDVRDLYLGKVGFADLEAAKMLAEQKGVQVTFPLMVAELVRYAMDAENLNHADFTSHIGQKYPFLSGQSTVEKLTFSQKRKVASIIQALGGRNRNESE